jgi:hypothetical protein
VVALGACVAQQRIDLESAAYVALAAVPLDTILAYRTEACPQVMVDRVVRYSKSIPIHAESGTLVARLGTRVPQPIAWTCPVTQLLDLTPLPDTAGTITQVLRVRLYVIGDTTDLSSRWFLALVAPPGLANPLLVSVQLTAAGSGWIVTRVAIDET